MALSCVFERHLKTAQDVFRLWAIHKCLMAVLQSPRNCRHPLSPRGPQVRLLSPSRLGQDIYRNALERKSQRKMDNGTAAV